MTVFDTQPTTPNYLNPLNFKFIIKKCPNIDFFAQRVNVPGFNLMSAIEQNPFVKIPFAGDHIEFTPLVVYFKVDGLMTNYMEIFNWITKEGFDQNYNQYKDISSQNPASGTGLKSDISIFILDALKNPIQECVIFDAFPISLTELQFDSTSEDVKFMTAITQFNYTYFDFRPVATA